MSGATRPPGQYGVVWNGRDDRGNVVEQGPYRIIIEAAREHTTVPEPANRPTAAVDLSRAYV